MSSDLLRRLLPALLENRTLNESGVRMLQKLHAEIKRKPSGSRTDEEWFVMGYFSLQTGDHAEAVSHFSEAIFENESFEAAFRFRASAYLEQRKFDEAGKDLDEALRLDPTYADAKYERIRLLYETDRDADAVAAAEAFTAEYPDNSRGYALLGSILEKAGKYAESLPAFDKAIELEDDNGLYFTQRGLAHYFGGQPALALPDLLTAQKLSGSNQVTHFNLGLVYAELGGQIKEAYRQFERAFKRDPSMLKQFAASASSTEATRLLGRLEAVLAGLDQPDGDGGRFYRDELKALLSRKLAETRAAG